MKYIYAPYNPNKHATDLRLNTMTNKLTWQSSPGLTVLIVRTRFGENAAQMMDEICERLSQVTLITGDYTRIGNGIEVRLVKVDEMVRNNGCDFKNEMGRYTVFACSMEGDNCEIYQPNLMNGIVKPYYDHAIKIHVYIEKETILKGLFKRHEVDSGFYSITFDTNLNIESYMDGDLSCFVGKFEIPITKEIIQQQTIYVETRIQPRVQSNTLGLILQ
ncbi:hypothetical protein P261_00365 [Lachnospiraceae bacterium TWA4]|nr:hypothetical protein P261_00365 [Lachnospiraceae bacterium TWA4]